MPSVDVRYYLKKVKAERASLNWCSKSSSESICFIQARKDPKITPFTKKNYFFSLPETSDSDYSIRHEATLQENLPSCGGWDAILTFLHYSIKWNPVTRRGSRARVFPLNGLPKLMTKNIFQRYPIVSTLCDCSGKNFPRRWLASPESDHNHLRPLTMEKQIP